MAGGADPVKAVLFALCANFAIALTWATGNPLYDTIGTLAIGVLLIVVAILVGVEVKALGTDVALIEAVNRAEVALRAAYPQVAFLFFEPDLHE